MKRRRQTGLCVRVQIQAMDVESDQLVGCLFVVVVIPVKLVLLQLSECWMEEEARRIKVGRGKG